MHVRTTHRQRLRGKCNRGDRIPDGLHGASFHESQYGARGGAKRIGDLAVPSDLLEVRVRTSCALWGWPIMPICLRRHPITGLSVQSVLVQFSNCFYVLILILSDRYLHVY